MVFIHLVAVNSICVVFLPLSTVAPNGFPPHTTCCATSGESAGGEVNKSGLTQLREKYLLNKGLKPLVRKLFA